VRTIRIYVADRGETLIRIAEKMCVDLLELTSLNPHVPNPHQEAAGIPIYLPLIVQNRNLRIPISNAPWIPTISPETMSEFEYDVIIVGTGAGGGAALWRLCQQWANNGKKIGVVEAGDLLIPTNMHNIATLEGKRLEQYYIDNSFPVADTDFREVIALGGRMLTWSALAPRMYTNTDYGWPIPEQEMERYYNIAEQTMRVTSEFYNDSPLNKLFLDQLWGNHYTHAINAPMAVDLRKSEDAIIHSNVYFSSIEFLAEAMNYRPFDLCLKTRAVKVLTDNTRVTGVRVMSLNKQTFDLKTKCLVLSANTFETPRLLLYSGIPGRAIGHYLTDHTAALTNTRLEPQDKRGFSGAVGILIPQVSGKPYQVQIEYPFQETFHSLQNLIKAPFELMIIGVSMVQPRFENRITLDPQKKDAFGLPEVKVHYSYTERDWANLDETEKTVKELTALFNVPVIFTDRNKVPFIGHHASSTCRMGDDPSTSAVNRYGQIHGISGLYVADNSVIPILGAANPTLTTVALSIRTADYIAGQL
jgi:choline dehydrogenase-like flavoprotein